MIPTCAVVASARLVYLTEQAILPYNKHVETSAAIASFIATCMFYANVHPHACTSTTAVALTYSIMRPLYQRDDADRAIFKIISNGPLLDSLSHADTYARLIDTLERSALEENIELRDNYNNFCINLETYFRRGSTKKELEKMNKAAKDAKRARDHLNGFFGQGNLELLDIVIETSSSALAIFKNERFDAWLKDRQAA